MGLTCEIKAGGLSNCEFLIKKIALAKLWYTKWAHYP